MLPGLTEEQNECLKELHIKAIDTAQLFFEDYANTRKDEYSESAKAELAKARAYLNLGDFDPDARFCERGVLNMDAKKEPLQERTITKSEKQNILNYTRYP